MFQNRIANIDLTNIILVVITANTSILFYTPLELAESVISFVSIVAKENNKGE